MTLFRLEQRAPRRADTARIQRATAIEQALARKHEHA
jgi:hypothetical protein